MTNSANGARPYDPRSASVPPSLPSGTGETPVSSERGNGVNQRFTSNRRRDPRKTTVEHQAGFLVLMVQRFAQRAAAEDPGVGLKALLKIKAVVDGAVTEVGRGLVEQVGESAVAADLSTPCDPWSRQRVYKRWGRPVAAERESA